MRMLYVASGVGGVLWHVPEKVRVVMTWVVMPHADASASDTALASAPAFDCMGRVGRIRSDRGQGLR